MKINTGIPSQDREAVAAGLKTFLADTFTLYLNTHKFHWNVTGPMFNTLHTMFEAQYNELWIAIDEVAERIRALGDKAPGSYAEFSKLTQVPAEVQAESATEMISALVEGNEAVIRSARALFPAAESANDQVTLDLLTQRLQVHEKTAWMLRSLLD